MYNLLTESLIVLFFLIAWFKTSIPFEIVLRTHDYYGDEESARLILAEIPFFGKVLNCPFCFSFWTSFVFGIFFFSGFIPNIFITSTIAYCIFTCLPTQK